MFKKILITAVAFLISIAGVSRSSVAQTVNGAGNAQHVDEYDVIVFGQSDFYPAQIDSFDVTLIDEFGNVTDGTAIVDVDGSFALTSSKQLINGSVSFVEGTLFDQTTGDPVTDFEIAVAADFLKWFKKWRKDLDGVTDPPSGRPCLYKYSHLQSNYENITMQEGDYFPHWDDYGEFEDHNKPFIEAVAANGQPVRDTFVNSDGSLKPATGTLKQERDILIAAGYEFDQNDGQWEK